MLNLESREPSTRADSAKVTEWWPDVTAQTAQR
jgi:hypothetical protein